MQAVDSAAQTVIGKISISAKVVEADVQGLGHVSTLSFHLACLSHMIPGYPQL
jgi:hypothetical protein